MKQKFLRVKVPDTSFDIPVGDNTTIDAIAQQLSMGGAIWFPHIWFARTGIVYVMLYEMEVDEANKQDVVDFIKPPRDFKQ